MMVRGSYSSSDASRSRVGAQLPVDRSSAAAAPALVSGPGPEKLDPGHARVTVLECGPEKFGAEFVLCFQAGYRQDVVDALKNTPKQARRTDPDGWRWYFKRAFLDDLIEIAKKCSVAQLVEGGVTTNLHTGERSEQLAMF